MDPAPAGTTGEMLLFKEAIDSVYIHRRHYRILSFSQATGSYETPDDQKG